VRVGKERKVFFRSFPVVEIALADPVVPTDKGPAYAATDAVMDSDGGSVDNLRACIGGHGNDSPGLRVVFRRTHSRRDGAAIFFTDRKVWASKYAAGF
jgi:hypothetical protein